MKKFLVPLVICISIFISGCETVYTSGDFENYQSKHTLVALVPFNVTITLKKLPEGITESDIQKQEEDEAFVFQKQMYTRFMKKQGQGKYTIDFQDIEKTNLLLKRGGMDASDLSSHTKEEIAAVLGVDSIISGSISRSKPMGTGAAIFSAVLIGYSVTNDVNVNINVHEGDDGKLLWSYDHQVAGGLGSSPEGVAKVLMKAIAKKFPYEKKD